MRPPHCWNFFEDSDEIKTEHVLRADADPNASYLDGRVKKFMEDIENLGYHLTKYQDKNWEMLRKFTIEIFKDEAKREHEQSAEEEKKNN